MGETDKRQTDEVVSVRVSRREAGKKDQQVPPVDIYETDDGWVLLADMPGVGKDDVNVEVRQGVLTIEGRMSGPVPAGQLVCRGFERADYFREFPLSEEVERERISATIRDGVLRVVLPKAETARTCRIPVEPG